MEHRPLDRLHQDGLHQAVLLSPDWLWLIDAEGTAAGVSPAQNRGENLYRWVYESDQPALQDACERLLRDGRPFILPFRAVLPDGTLLWLEGKGYRLEGSTEQNIRAALSAKDITSYKQREERLMRLAYYDSLTGLPNRRLFKDRFSQALHRAKRYQHKLALIYLDLDDFKHVNDTWGHTTGDELLTITASRLSHSVREPDSVCRMGGDEFVLLLQQFQLQEDIVKIGRRIGEVIGQPYHIGGHSVSITSSLGASFYPEDGGDFDTLLQCADAAMYASKQQGKNNMQFYSET